MTISYADGLLSSEGKALALRSICPLNLQFGPSPGLWPSSLHIILPKDTSNDNGQCDQDSGSLLNGHRGGATYHMLREQTIIHMVSVEPWMPRQVDFVWMLTQDRRAAYTTNSNLRVHKIADKTGRHRATGQGGDSLFFRLTATRSYNISQKGRFPHSNSAEAFNPTNPDNEAVERTLPLL